jgi:hypothetical protein
MSAGPKEEGAAMVYKAGIDPGKRTSHIKVITRLRPEAPPLGGGEGPGRTSFTIQVWLRRVSPAVAVGSPAFRRGGFTAEREAVEDLKIESEPKEFARIIRKYKGQIVAGCEATSNAFWVADTLEPLVEKCLVGHTAKIRWIAEARIKTDEIDAGILAELVRADLFPSIAIPPLRIRELRELVRGLVRLRRQGNRYAWISRPVAGLKPSTRYRFSGWTRGAAVGGPAWLGNWEARVSFKDGSSEWVRRSVDPTSDEKGKLLLAVVVEGPCGGVWIDDLELVVAP